MPRRLPANSFPTADTSDLHAPGYYHLALTATAYEEFYVPLLHSAAIKAYDEKVALRCALIPPEDTMVGYLIFRSFDHPRGALWPALTAAFYGGNSTVIHILLTHLTEDGALEIFDTFKD